MKKIPDNAKKVFEGLIFDVYHWQQEMFDGSFETFEAIKKRSAVFALATHDGKIVINHEQQPSRSDFFSLPGGLTEKDQVDVLGNTKRELLEETGYESDDWVLWFESDEFGHSQIDTVIYFFIARNCMKIRDQKLGPGEKIETKLLTFEEFLELRSEPKFRNSELIPILEKVANSEVEKQKLKELLGVTN